MSVSLSYVLPFKFSNDTDIAELGTYLAFLGAVVDELIVVDGSDEIRFADHHARWSDYCIHVRPRPGLAFANGKVDGVTTGVELARNEKVIVADDDVRYDEPSLRRMASELDTAELVRPQNYFTPRVWHAMWDMGRSLLNRSFGADYPGTLGLRRSAFLSCRGYDGDVMFENLELIRTIEEAGGRSKDLPDLFVARRPPTTRRFWSQRPRQAYDDLAQPWRLVVFASLLPVSLHRTIRRRPNHLMPAAAGIILLAEKGRRRAGGAKVFPARSAILAPLWVAERAICSWIALYFRVRGGVPYGGGRIKRAANSRARIRRRLRSSGHRSRP